MFIDRLKEEVNDILGHRKNGLFVHNTSKIRVYFILFLGFINFFIGSFVIYQNYFLTSIKIVSDESDSEFFVPKNAEYKIYLQFNDYYQNYLNYSKSISYDQLRGEKSPNLSRCKPFDRRNEKVIYPCGKIAESFPQISILIDNMEVSDREIVWKNEKNFIKPTKYKINEIIVPYSWNKKTDIKKLNKNYRFINWIEIAAFNSFRKLHGKIFLTQGYHFIKILSNKKFDNTQVVITQTSFFGVKNVFLGVAVLFTGLILITSSFFLLKFSNFIQREE